MSFTPFGTIADLRSYSDLTITTFSVVEGGRTGLFDLDSTDSSSDDGAMVVLQGPRRFRRRHNAMIHPEWFGASGNGTTNDYGAFESMLNYLDLTTSRFEIRLTANNYKINSSLTLKFGNYAIRGNGSILDFSSLIGTNAINITGALQPSFNQSRVKFEGFEIRANIATARKNGKVGIYVSAGSGFAIANSGIYDISINNFETGIKFGDRAYIDSWYNVSIFECDTCIDFASGTLDSGENHRFVNCNLCNSNLALNSAHDGNIRFIGCSIDYNLKNVQASYGIVYFDKCHIEGHNFSDRVFEITGGSSVINITESNIAVTNTVSVPDFYFYVNPDTDAYRAINVKDCFISGIETSTGELCGGCNTNACKFNITGTKAYWITSIPHITNRFNNLLSNGNFENPNLNFDDIYISTDNFTTLTNRLTSTNITVTTSTVIKFDSNNSLAITKTSPIVTNLG